MSRPEKPIDWNKVDTLLIAGCLGTEIAAHFDMHPNTFYDRVTQKYNISFTDYMAEKRCKGDSILRHKQFEKAINGDNTLLIWLGKNRLGQRDGEAEQKITPDIINQHAALMAIIKEAQDARKIDDKSINEEQKS